MKTSTMFLALVSLAAAELVVRQDAANSTVTAAPGTPTADTSPITVCLSACDPTDVNCRAQCVGGAHPNSAQVSQTNDCINSCSPGSGSAADTDRYNSCVRVCINTHYLSGQSVGIITPGSVASTGTPVVDATSTGAASSASQSTNGVLSSAVSEATRSATRTTGSTGSTGTPSGSATPTSTASNAASGPTLVSAGGLAGLVLAFFAL